MNPDHWEMEFYEDPSGKEPCRDFIDGLDVAKAAAMRSALVHILARQGPDVCETEFGKNLGKGLYEFRLRHDEAEILNRVRPDLAAKLKKAGAPKILLRVFFHAHGDKLILLLGGYDKGEDPSSRRQQGEIDQARKALAAWKEAQRRAQKAGKRRSGVAPGHSFVTYWKKFRRRS
ncbi:MAG TPA: hypothetical protein VMF35_01230 [Acidimicrobiales bacterium]|nr:hypothetical protein [Acidimicrobiales bacterium]